MLKRHLLIYFISLTLLACNRPPKACIENEQTTATVGTPITFTSCSKRTLSQDWFISGPTGAPENSMAWSDPQFTHAFSIPGTYIVTLNAYSKFSFLGEVSTETQEITIQ